MDVICVHVNKAFVLLDNENSGNPGNLSRISHLTTTMAFLWLLFVWWTRLLRIWMAWYSATSRDLPTHFNSHAAVGLFIITFVCGWSWDFSIDQSPMTGNPFPFFSSVVFAKYIVAEHFEIYVVELYWWPVIPLQLWLTTHLFWSYLHW